jgi:adenylate cyclase
MLIVQVIIMAAVLLLDFVSAEFGKKLLGEYVVDNLFAREFLPVYYKMQIFIFILLFFLEIELILGRNFLPHYLLGKYNRPKKEHRIFMFLDLTGSTGLAESLGDDKYYQLLNDCYRLLSDPLIRTHGEVLKYVGDEVILSWPYKTGLKRNQCIELFYTFQEALVANDAVFQRRYGVLPRFKAGVHEGEVIAAYLGDIRKQLDFSGDVMNTTARIAGACNTYGADLLLSEQLFDALPLRKYNHSAIGEVELKGKTVKISLVKLTGRKE